MNGDATAPPPADTRWVRLAGLIAAASLALWLLWVLRGVLAPLAIALAIAYVLDPLVGALQRRGWPRLRATILVYVLGFGTLLTGVVFLTLGAVAQLVALQEKLPGYVEGLGTWLRTHFPALVPEPGAPLLDRALVERILGQHGEALGRSAWGAASGILSGTLYGLTALLLIPLYTFFFLWHFDDMLGGIRDHLPARHRGVIIHIAQLVERSMASFFRGRLVTCGAVGALLGLGWTLADVPHGLLLGAAGGLLNLVPFLSLLTLPVALLLSYLEAMQSGVPWVTPVLLAMGVFLGVQAVESFLLSPWVESRFSGLHPLTTLIALLVGANLAGVLGALLAIPTAAILKALAGTYWLPAIRRRAGWPQAVSGAMPGSPDRPVPGGPEQSGAPPTNRGVSGDGQRPTDLDIPGPADRPESRAADGCEQPDPPAPRRPVGP